MRRSRIRRTFCALKYSFEETRQDQPLLIPRLDPILRAMKNAARRWQLLRSRSVAAVLGAQTAPTALPRAAPTVDQILSLKRAGSPEISPDGRWVAYTVRETNWDDNAYDTEIWLADATTGATRQLTNAKKSSQSPAWSPDGSKLAFISDRTDKRQIYVINPQGGEAEALTSARGRRQQLRVVARRQDDRLHRDRAEADGDQGSREEVRRVPGRRAGSPDDAPLRRSTSPRARRAR